MDIKKALLLGLCVPALAFGVAACSSDDESSSDTTTEQTDSAMTDEAAPMNIVETAQATPDLSTLVKAVVAADLVETLSGAGPFTVFAPTNEAFEALPPAELARLLEPANRDELAKILTYHVVAGDILSADLADGQKVKTVEGQDLTITVDGDTVKVNDATVVKVDIETSNGVVHVIDGVLLPPN
ncbi:MAG: fasciclin domain-containing protein [Solirubrobacterales bacterium]